MELAVLNFVNPPAKPLDFPIERHLNARQRLDKFFWYGLLTLTPPSVLMVRGSSHDASPSATKSPRADVGAAHSGAGAVEQGEAVMVQETSVSSTAPNSPPAF